MIRRRLIKRKFVHEVTVRHLFCRWTLPADIKFRGICTTKGHLYAISRHAGRTTSSVVYLGGWASIPASSGSIPVSQYPPAVSQFPRHAKFWRARSWLYRNRFMQVNCYFQDFSRDLEVLYTYVLLQIHEFCKRLY